MQPLYQHFAALLGAFSTRFAEFRTAQAQYVRLRPGARPMLFAFEGEYSVVADPSGGSVDAVVHCVVRNVQAALGLAFGCVTSLFSSGPKALTMGKG